jgi:hypothetical protein
MRRTRWDSVLRTLRSKLQRTATENVDDTEVGFFSGMPLVTVNIEPQMVAFRDLAPLLDELKKPFPQLRTDQTLGAGGIDPWLVLVFVYVASQYAQGFFSRAGEAHYDLLHKELANTVNSLKERHTGLGAGATEDLPITVIPVTLAVGRVQFNFHEKLSEAEVVERLRKADEYVQGLPARDLAAPGSEPSEQLETLNLFWDETSASWTEDRPR